MKLKSPSRAATTLLVGMALFVATTIFAQKLAAERAADATTTKLVCEMVAKYHISQGEINDETSKKLLKRYLKQLDRQKLYLLASDVKAIQTHATKLDDLMKSGNVDFAYDVFKLYLRRLEERMAMADKLIDADHDFSLDEEMVIDADKTDWAQSKAELDERWRRRIKYDLLNLKLDDTELAESRERMHKRYRNIRTMARQTEDAEMLEMYLSSLTHTFDPHSSYMSPETLEDFRIQMELSLEVIGAALQSEDGLTVVKQIVPGGAAHEEGSLAVGDKITGVAQGEDGEMVDIVEMKLSKVVRFIRGKKGTIVRLQIKAEDGGETKVLSLTRQKIELKESAVKGEIIEAPERLGGRKLRIGVVHIPSFYRDFRGAQRGDKDFKSTSRDVRKVLDEFHLKGTVDVVIVDLRMNGGGALSESIEVSGLFIDRGPVVQVKEQNGHIKSHDDVDSGVAYDGPLVVVCNRLSASASEIFAGAIKDYKRGIVVGDSTTHGKGTVQNVMPVGRRFFGLLNQQQRGALKLTINQFYRVNGDSTQNRGVRSDVVLPSLLDHMDLGESFLDNALAFDQVPAAGYKPVGLVADNVVQMLQQRSKKRVMAEPDFQKKQKEIERYLSRKNRKTITLNEEKLRQERDADKSDEDKKKKDEEKDDPDKKKADAPIFPKAFYNDEILSISIDYIDLLKGQKTAKK
ncbi:MAG: carboxy terminal-processing peptidase [Planctomycetaceae bacterium]|nr:carboxy terminal-processing peptidase [Planctomycetaceae bacterium]